MSLEATVAALADTLGLSSLLARLGRYTLLDHWQQGEFHHDVVLRANVVAGGAEFVFVVATNCNGGVKEVLAFDAVPERWALWRARCPDNEAFTARASVSLPPLRACARTLHWFDPCALLSPDARSELPPSCRRRAVGGGWEAI